MRPPLMRQSAGTAEPAFSETRSPCIIHKWPSELNFCVSLSGGTDSRRAPHRDEPASVNVGPFAITLAGGRRLE